MRLSRLFFTVTLMATAVIPLASRPESKVVDIGLMTAGVIMDGSLDDWPGDATVILLGEAAHTLPRAAKWGGACDLSGAVRIAWDETYLYLAVDVSDDKPMQAASIGAEPWQGDSVEVFFNAFPGEQRKTGFKQIALVPPIASDAKWVMLSPQGEVTGANGTAVARDNGYTLECRIPWTNLHGFAPRVGAKLGFQVMLNDRDGKGRKSQLCWYPSAVTYVQPLDMNVLELREKGAGSFAGNVLAGPTGAVVTDPNSAAFSVVTDMKAAATACFSTEKGESVTVPLTRSGERLSVGECRYALEGREGTATFRVDILDSTGAAIATTTFKTELAGGRYTAVRQRLKAVQARLKAMNGVDPEANAGVGFWTSRVAALEANEARPEAVTAKMIDSLLGELTEIEDACDKLERGEDPYALRTGSYLRAYRSPLTGEFSPHSLFVPRGIKAGEKRPLIVLLHGIFGDDRHLFEMLESVRDLGVIVYQASSYRQFDWSDVSAAETWAGLDQVIGTQPVDPDRIYLIGHHIGGRGVFQLAMDRPWLFAALAPMYSGIDTRPPYEAMRLYPRFYEEAARGNLIPFPHYKEPARPELISDDQERLLMERLSLATRAENIASLPIRAVRGESQPDAAAEGMMLFERLRGLGSQVTERHEVGAQHGSRPPELDDPAFYRWLLAHRRSTHPTVQAHVVTSLRENTTWLARVEGLCSPAEPGRVRADWSGDLPKLKTSGVEAISPVFDRLRFERWEVDGQEFPAVHLVRTKDGDWRPGLPAKELKRHGVSGPIDDFQFERFIYVYGDADEKVARKLADRGLGAQFSIKRDRELTDADRQSAHLVLVGRPETNTELARAAGDLPLKWTRGSIQLGDVIVSGPGSGACMVYPSPHVADRYIVVITGADELGYSSWAHRAGVDYVLVQKSQSDPRQVEPALRGVFSNEWTVDSAFQFRPSTGTSQKTDGAFKADK